MIDVWTRPAAPADLPFLHDMLYEAAIVDAGVRRLDKAAVLAHPLVARWLAGWGHESDRGLIAATPDGAPVGAAWYRLYPREARGEGIVAWPGVPELAIGVHPEHRGRGVGGALLAALIARARRDGYRRLALTVDPANPAIRLYRRHGFGDASTRDPAAGTSLLLVTEL